MSTAPEADDQPGPAVSFVIPVRNDAAGLERCLASIRSNGLLTQNVEILVADNGSIDGSYEVARSAGATAFKLPGLSVAALRNEAARKARGEILAFVDADHEIATDWLGNAIRLLADPSIAAAGAPYSTPAGANWVQRAYGTLRDHRPGIRDTRWLGSGNLLVRREVFERIGGFDESLVTCEDVDLCMRLRAHGHRVVSDSRLASVHHGDPASLRQLFKSELWRGRDNLRVSFRRLPSARDLPGIVLPFFSLVSMVLLAIGIPSIPSGGTLLWSAGLIGLTGTTLLRAFRMTTNYGPESFRSLAGMLAVATIFEIARALALVVRVPHRREDLASSAT